MPAQRDAPPRRTPPGLVQHKQKPRKRRITDPKELFSPRNTCQVSILPTRPVGPKKTPLLGDPGGERRFGSTAGGSPRSFLARLFFGERYRTCFVDDINF
ncbi:hypothetical protein EVAR_46115_1 [Eumeta japonica]|uniref:Uncharacterized protein n=1 Tax=Eumeta variegata TaxID=151549 RepID=A0A4C1XTS4_EUMVA|nr:hypothetical protein EVAR_46115_1 [Eumeta japonica]